MGEHTVGPERAMRIGGASAVAGCKGGEEFGGWMVECEVGTSGLVEAAIVSWRCCEG